MSLFFSRVIIQNMESASPPLEPALINRMWWKQSCVSSLFSTPTSIARSTQRVRPSERKSGTSESQSSIPASQLQIPSRGHQLSAESMADQRLTNKPRKAANVTHRTMKQKCLSVANSRKKKNGSGSARIYGPFKGESKVKDCVHICNSSTCVIQAGGL